MLKPVNEELIERYVRFSDELTLEQVVQAERLLEHSAEARELASWFRQFYKTLDKEHPEGCEFPKKIALSPLHVKDESNSYSAMLFAAKTEAQKDSQETRHVATYHHQECNIVLRISVLPGGKKLILYLIAPNLTEAHKITLEMPERAKHVSPNKGENTLKKTDLTSTEHVN